MKNSTQPGRRNCSYSAPALDVLTISAERGFAASLDLDINDTPSFDWGSGENNWWTEDE